uniref:Uncharacterized protein n=1 Tax=Arundo donax TaxID=35708 RepID=A0A0A9I1Z1_ARUDO
MSGWEAAGLST